MSTNTARKLSTLHLAIGRPQHGAQLVVAVTRVNPVGMHHITPRVPRALVKTTPLRQLP